MPASSPRAASLRLTAVSGAVPVAGPTLARSRAYCEQLTRAQARNFYYGLKLLPEPKRSAMFALYAYMRLVDDIADAEDDRSTAQRLDELEAWRLQTRAVLDGRSLQGHAFAGHVLWPAFGDMARRYGAPAYIFDDVIAGQRQDLEPAVFENFRAASRILLSRGRDGRAWRAFISGDLKAAQIPSGWQSSAAWRFN